MINAETCKKNKMSNLEWHEKIAKDVTGEKLKFMGETFINVFFYGKERKLKAFIMWNAPN